MQRPSLTDDDNNNNNNGKLLLSKSLTVDSGQTKQQRTTRPTRPTPPIIEQQQQQQPQRLGRSLLSNDNWRQETMADVRINAKAIEQSDQNILFGKGKI
jgi:hypothetical protein